VSDNINSKGIKKEETLNRIKELGISNDINLPTNDIEKILSALLEDKKLDVETFKNYLKVVNENLLNWYEALKKFSESTTRVTEKALDIIKTAIEELGNALKKDNLSSEERILILNQIHDHVIHARELNKGHTKFTKYMLLFGGLGIGSLIYLKGEKNNILIKELKDRIVELENENLEKENNIIYKISKLLTLK
jgi:hypothetical protein